MTIHYVYAAQIVTLESSRGPGFLSRGIILGSRTAPSAFYPRYLTLLYGDPDAVDGGGGNGLDE